MEKSPDAFRTISEVAEWLDVPTHVLRFWESRFTQVKPVKRAGGRRYYRPSDMLLIGGIKRLLHDDGMTIRGVQKLLREEGIKHVSAFSQPLETQISDAVEATAVEVPAEAVGESEVIAIVRNATESAAGGAARPRDVPPRVVSFGSVRKRDPELPLDPPSRAVPLIDEDETTPETAAELPDPTPVAEPVPEPAPEPAARAIPPTPEVPETDAEDDAPAHAAPAGPVARLIARSRLRPAPEDVRIEDVVSKLRGIRSRIQDRDAG